MLRYVDFIIFDYWRFFDVKDIFVDGAPEANFYIHAFAFYAICLKYMFIPEIKFQHPIFKMVRNDQGKLYKKPISWKNEPN